MFKKLNLTLSLLWHSLFYGMKNAEETAFKAQNEFDGGNSSGIEQQKEKQSVYKDLLRGELTQEVIELRHEMYYSDRGANKFMYNGGGRSRKRNNIFNESLNLEDSDNLEFVLLQKNTTIPDTLSDYGIGFNRDNPEVILDKETDQKRIPSYKSGGGITMYTDFDIDMAVSKGKKRIIISRDFYPSFKLEDYINFLVVRKIDDTHSQLELYLSKYKQQFNNIHKIVIATLKRIYEGDTRSTNVLDFDTLEFVTDENALGIDHLKYFKFKNIHYKNTTIFEDSYVLKFTAENDIYDSDLLDDIYDEKTAQKCKNHERREGAQIDFTEINEELKIQNDIEGQAEMLRKLKKEQ